MYLDGEDSYYLISYDEGELMRAEAAVKGWISTPAESHFNNGVTAAINSWIYFDPSFSVGPDKTAAHLVGRGFAAVSNANKLRLIGEEYWAANFLNAIEAWSNWIRTGFPVLTPTNDPFAFKGNFIPRRRRYWENESGSNPQNYRRPSLE
jgi:hypothetical protein